MEANQFSGSLRSQYLCVFEYAQTLQLTSPVQMPWPSARLLVLASLILCAWEVSATCGDGLQEMGEQCEDGNTVVWYSVLVCMCETHAVSVYSSCMLSLRSSSAFAHTHLPVHPRTSVSSTLMKRYMQGKIIPTNLSVTEQVPTNTNLGVYRYLFSNLCTRRALFVSEEEQ